MKTCRKCGRAKEEDGFPRPDERVCKTCRYEECKARRKADPHRQYVYNRKWAESHRDHVRMLGNAENRRRARRAIDRGLCLACSCVLDTKGPYCAACYSERRAVIAQAMAATGTRPVGAEKREK